MRQSTVDRRAVLFLVAAAIGFALTLVADPEHRWVAVTTGVTYVVLAVLAYLDGRSRGREDE
jgi:uncharacterized membrane protein